MIAIDTSSIIAYLSEKPGRDTICVDDALEKGIAVFPPLVLVELLSDRNLSEHLVKIFKSIPLLQLAPGFWERAGLLRAKVLGGGHKARIADTLIAQSCIDKSIALITRDRDFRHFQKEGGLMLLA